MIKWLTGAPRKSRQWVTDDPLATIQASRPTQVYAVTRVNPIFVEEDVRKKDLCVSSGAGKSGSSGYESQRSSCGWSAEDHPEDTLDHAPTPAAPASTHGKSVLSTIPEGRVDYCIPRPIWPRYEGRQRRAPAVRVDGRRAPRTRRTKRETQGDADGSNRCPYDLLRELSTTIQLAADAASQEAVPAEVLLRDISLRINKSLDALAHNLSSERVAPEKVAKKSPPELTPAESSLQRMAVTSTSITVGISHSHSSESCCDAEMEAGRLSLLRRLGRFPPCATSGEPLYDLARGGSLSTSTSTSASTSSSSSSGFSDLTPTPPSSAALRPFGPVFLHDNPTTVPTRVRNSMIYETLQNRSPTGYEKLGPECRIQLDSQWTICEKSPSCELEEKQICVFPKPDFTLDGHQAELLLRRLQAGKRQRCWCRFLTTALGLIFFLFSVMAVSMMLTNGKRMFGSL